ARRGSADRRAERAPTRDSGSRSRRREGADRQAHRGRLPPAEERDGGASLPPALSKVGVESSARRRMLQRSAFPKVQKGKMSPGSRIGIVQSMICPECHTPNPDQAENCTECSHSLSDPNLATRSDADAPTLAGPTTLKEWAQFRSSAARSISLVLPEGLEIGHRYKIIRLLGVGGMGSVYRVHDRDLDRDVALKLIRSDIADNSSTLARFKREIQLSSKVTHKNVLRVYDLGEADGIKFLTMHYVDGEDLSHVLKRTGKLEVPRLLRILGQICDGLGAAHEQGVIHRDLKPQNVMV